MAAQATETPIPPGYLKLDEAAAALGDNGEPVSPSTIERLVRRKSLRSKLLPRPGKKPERVYSQEDVERVKLEKQRRKEAAPPSAQASSALERRPASGAPPAFFSELVNLMREVVVTQQQRQLPAPEPAARLEVPLHQKLWLSPREARAYSGLTRDTLRKMIREDVLVSVGSGRGIRIMRKSLEAFEG